MLERFRAGKERLLDAEEQCRAKSSASRDVVDTVNELRSRLTGIAARGNKAITDILAKKEPDAAKLPEVTTAIQNANDDAAAAGMAANTAIVDATQQMFTRMGIDAHAREWLGNNGANFDAPPCRPPLTAGEMNATAPAFEPSSGGTGFGGISPLPASLPSLTGGMPPDLQGDGLSSVFAEIPAEPGELIPPSEDGTDGSGLTEASAPQVPPSPSPSSTPMAGGMLIPAVPNPGATAAVPATPPVTAAPASGPLPGYGADLRPAGAIRPAAPAGAVAPASPSPLGGPTTTAPGGTAVASATVRPVLARAGADTATKRRAAQRDLQHTVDAVARQAPNLAWAAGLRDDGTTTVLVTDLAGGWIPPTVTLPPGVTLLEPAHRRRDMTAIELLGAVIAVAAHRPNTHLGESGPRDPIPGAGERARYGQCVDELGPALIDAAGAGSGLPRIAQTVARAVARRSGVVDNEIDLFRRLVTKTATRVLSAYPGHTPRNVADWMLLAAIDALIDGSEELARYHLAWHRTVPVGRGGLGHGTAD